MFELMMELAFRPPDGPYVRNPSLGFLCDLIFKKGETYWQCNAGAGELIVGDGPLFDNQGVQAYGPVRALSLSLKEPHGFLLLFSVEGVLGDEPTDELYVAISSTDYSQKVTIFLGDDLTVPTA